ncbi:hypothetical protein AVDCRST_MAG92-4398 [uncultured Coleofasciculus sp.]|uniref:Uncharacterized protein n=1 Tax=uncultured Coleofasciculus sp. TaxID=1267456 RepID=A0A6J4K0J6_9CYAN|nr:hypothetical protein AVDCRST_MAG92-4398 [uncultured Coleofasciculus sp.]
MGSEQEPLETQCSTEVKRQAAEVNREFQEENIRLSADRQQFVSQEEQRQVAEELRISIGEAQRTTVLLRQAIEDGQQVAAEIRQSLKDLVEILREQKTLQGK